MKIKQLITLGCFILISITSNAQTWIVKNDGVTTTVNTNGSFAIDSILRIPLRDTLKPYWWNIGKTFNGAFQLGKDGKPYYYYGGRWYGFAGGGGGGITSIAQGYGIAVSPTNPITSTGSIAVDTTAIASKLFTANEYAPISTTVRLTGVQTLYSKTIASSIIQAPTFSMVTNGGALTDSLLVMNPSSGLVYLMNPSRISGGGGSVTSVATNNGTGITGGTITTTGTLAIDTSTIISTKANVTAVAATKLNISDTASMLANYYDVRDTGRSNGNVVTGGTLSKVTDSLGALIGGGGVSAASVAEINTGTDNTKFASPLGLAGSKYLDQSGTKVAGTTAGTSTAYTLTLTPAITSYTTGLSLWVKFHLANTGAATINVNGLGAKSLVKDLSTALVANDIPINQWYTLVYDGTNFLIQDIGFGGINLSARLLGALSDETGTGVSVFGTSPTFTTSVLGGATFSAFNTTTTNLSLGGAATTMTIGGTPTTAITHTYSGNATATATTKTLNFGTGGASGSTTAINIGSATSGATNNIKINVLPASDATGDIWFRNASGFMTRLGIGTTGQVLTVAAGLPSWATAGAGSGWGLTGNAGTTPVTNYLGTSDNTDLTFGVNATRAGRIGNSTTYNASYGLLSLNPSLTGAGNTAFGGYSMGGANGNGYNNTAVGYGALANITTANLQVSLGYQAGLGVTNGARDINIGYQTSLNNTGGSNNVIIGNGAYTSATAGDNNIIIGDNQQAAISTASNQLNIGGGVFGIGLSGSAASPAGRIGIGTSSPNASAILDLTSTTQGFLPPRMTGTQASAIASKAEGLMVYVTDATGGFAAKGWYGWNGAAWEKLNP